MVKVSVRGFRMGTVGFWCSSGVCVRVGFWSSSGVVLEYVSRIDPRSGISDPSGCGNVTTGISGSDEDSAIRLMTMALSCRTAKHLQFKLRL